MNNIFAMRKRVNRIINQIQLALLMLKWKNGKQNLLAWARKRGKLITPNGFIFQLTKDNYKDIRNIFLFSIKYGVNFYNGFKSGVWHYDNKNNVITTSQGLKFSIKNFDPVIFCETFLYDIHFSDFSLKNKIVIQAGGFTGDTALYFADRGASVYSFEPDRTSFRLAVSNIALNPMLKKKITMKNWAIGKNGYVKFPTSGLGENSMYDLNKDMANVRSYSIGSILRKFHIKHPYLLDLDIKGSEFEIINDPAISKFQMVRIEYTTSLNGRVFGNIGVIISKLKSLGFNKMRIYKHNELAYDLQDHGTIEARK